MKRQKIIIGSIVEIILSDTQKALGRIYPNNKLLVYDKPFDIDHSFALNDLNFTQKLFIVSIYEWVIKKGHFSIIAFAPLTEQELLLDEPMFWQSNDNFQNCILLYPDLTEVKVSPKECVGFERLGVFDDIGIIKRINDMFGGVKKFYGYYDNLVRNTDSVDPKMHNPMDYFNSIELNY